MWRVQVASTGTSAPSLWSNPTHAKANAPRGRPRWPNLCRPCTTVVPVLVMRLFPVLQHLRRQPGGHRMLWLPPRPLPPLVELTRGSPNPSGRQAQQDGGVAPGRAVLNGRYKCRQHGQEAARARRMEQAGAPHQHPGQTLPGLHTPRECQVTLPQGVSNCSPSSPPPPAPPASFPTAPSWSCCLFSICTHFHHQQGLLLYLQSVIKSSHLSSSLPQLSP